MGTALSKKQIILLLLVISVLVAGIYYVHLLLFKPKKIEIEQLQTNVKSVQSQLEQMNQKDSVEIAPLSSSKKIQQKIPVIPLTEQLLLQFERAETLSNSEITSMEFTETDFLSSVETGENTANQANDSSQANKDVKTQNELSSTNASQILTNSAVKSGLKQITATLTVESPSYFELEKFISTIEHQTRITKVDSLTFTGGVERTSVAENNLPLEYSISVSTFYLPQLTDLKDDAPKIVIPEPSNKRNPLIQQILDEKTKTK